MYRCRIWGRTVGTTSCPHWAHSATILLPLKMFFIANRTHSICSRISIKATSCTTQHGPWGLVSLLSHIFLRAWAGVQKSGLRATPARWDRAEAWGWASPTPWSRRRGREAGRSLGRGWCYLRRRGVLLCSCSSTKRGLDTPELGKWEEGSEGGQRRRRREDRRPRRLTLLGALAVVASRLRRRRVRPSPRANGARAARAGRREDPLMALSVASATADEAAWLPGTSELLIEKQTGPRSADWRFLSARRLDSEGGEGAGSVRQRKPLRRRWGARWRPLPDAPPPPPVTRSERRGGVWPRCHLTEPSHWPGSGPRVELERASLAEDAFLFLTWLWALGLPPSDFLTHARFSPSEFSRFVWSPFILTLLTTLFPPLKNYKDSPRVEEKELPYSFWVF